MEENAHQVMTHRLVAEKTPIDNVRKPRERMPVAGVASLKCPGNTLQTEAVLNVSVSRDVVGIVVIYKFESANTREYRSGSQGQQQGDEGGVRENIPPRRIWL